MCVRGFIYNYGSVYIWEGFELLVCMWVVFWVAHGFMFVCVLIHQFSWFLHFFGYNFCIMLAFGFTALGQLIGQVPEKLELVLEGVPHEAELELGDLNLLPEVPAPQGNPGRRRGRFEGVPRLSPPGSQGFGQHPYSARYGFFYLVSVKFIKFLSVSLFHFLYEKLNILRQLHYSINAFSDFT